MSVFGVSGFYNAPVSKCIFMITLFINLFSAIYGMNRGIALFGYGSLNLKFSMFYRIITGTFIFGTVGELFFGLILLYIFRLFERHYGSQKYFIFSLISLILTLIFQFTFLVISPIMRELTNGPYGIIYASLVCYIFDIPSTETFKVWKITVTEKYFVYLLALQHIISNFPNSLFVAVCGILSGLIYRTDLFRLNEIIPPNILTELSNKYIYPLVHTPLVMSSRNQEEQIQPIPQRQNQTQERVIQRQDRVQGNNFVPRQDYVQILTEMGFDRNTVVNILQRTNNNLENAMEILISQ